MTAHIIKMSFDSSVSYIPLKDLQLFTLLSNGTGVTPDEVNTDSSSPLFGKSLLNVYYVLTLC